MWHAPQQQHAEPTVLHWIGIWLHGAPGKNCPPICAHDPEVSCWQIIVAVTQHAPETSWAHTAGLHTPLGPYHVPPLFTQSQLDAVAQLPFRQHLPKSTVEAHVLGVHVPPGKYIPAPGHWAAVAVTHAPVHGVQHTPPIGHVTPAHDAPYPSHVPLHAPGDVAMKHPYTPAALVPQHAPRHGLGWHVVEVTTIPPGYGQGTAVEHAPVCGSQHTCDAVWHGWICEHASPSEKISGGWQCETSGWIEHRPVAGSQHAPCVPGGHGLGVHDTAVTCTVPVGHAAPGGAVWHKPVIGSQQMIACGGHVTPAHVEPLPKYVPLHAVAEATMKHPYPPAELIAQHAPFTGGHGLGVHEVPANWIGCDAGQTVPGNTTHVPPTA